MLLPCFQDVVGCNSSPVEGAESGDDSLVYLCSALSGDDGAFVFPSLASGDYTVVRTQSSHLLDFSPSGPFVGWPTVVSAAA